MGFSLFLSTCVSELTSNQILQNSSSSSKELDDWLFSPVFWALPPREVLFEVEVVVEVAAKFVVDVVVVACPAPVLFGN
jgi:hypothetical protein